MGWYRCRRGRDRTHAALRGAHRESPRVRDADLRPLLEVHQPAGRRGGRRHRERTPRRLRDPGHRSRGTVAVVGDRPGRHRTHPRLPRPGRSAPARAAARGAVPLDPAGDPGRPRGRVLLAGAVPGGGRRRPRVLPPLRRQVASQPAALRGRRASRRPHRLQYAGGGARLARRGRQAAAADRAGLHQRAGSQAYRRGLAGKRGAPEPRGRLRGRGALGPRLRDGGLLGHGEDAVDLRVLAGRGHHHGALRGRRPSRRSGSRAGDHRAV